ncbi:MAG: tetratricopeptide repeat-containing sulfotransferase family protein [Alphaproteobacteria bacterium]
MSQQTQFKLRRTESSGTELERMRRRIAQLQQLHAALHRANELFERRQYTEAATLLEKIVDREPNYFGAWFLLGKIKFESNDLWKAVSCFNRASMLNTADVPTLINLGLTYTKLDARELAEQILDLALLKEPENVNISRALALVFKDDRDYQRAAEMLYRAHQLQPSSSAIVQELGIVHFELGNMEEARHWLFRALKLAKENPDKKAIAGLPVTLLALSLLPIELENVDLMSEIETAEATQDQALPETSQNKLRLAKNRVLERTGHHNVAWQHLEAVNAKIWSDVKPEVSSYFRRQEESFLYARAFNFSDVHPLKLRHQGVNPIFIVGASRSGKTTLEGLLGGFEEVRKGYESKVVERALARTSLQVGLPKLRNFWSLPDNVDGDFSNVFNQELSGRAQGSRFFTVTYPGVINHAGRLARILDNAVFVFLKRDMSDHVYRCYQKQYAKGNNYSYDLATCRDYIENYNTMMDFWHKKLNMRSIMINYEDLVDNPRKALGQVAKRIQLKLPTDMNYVVGDDRDCAKPYETQIHKALG